MTLTDFLLARIAEDETVGRDWNHHRGKIQVNGGGDWYLRLVNPARVLAECEAKRRIVNLHRVKHEREGAPGFWCATVRLLALPYADHPDYREEWKP